ncbi:uncharacterized protein FIBRA_01473 [Fibroporia radiculosa]|uniref:Uncharacterized protein n=1 Tax=Fibroporia radiculosa TaxID=599839 RepID=J4GKB9_9APHY|nr:uncharacterized protein FIBRA_01473 [Fibroporia radiculosa]CCL99455.1 predicted protein [Fibroporia radiculosa]
MDVSPIVLPLAFPSGGLTSSNDDVGKHLISWSCSSSSPTRLVAWGYSSNASAFPSIPESIGHYQGVAIGCEDGSIYIFHPLTFPDRRKRSSIDSKSAETHGSSRPTSPLRYSGLNRPHSHSRSGSPSSTKSGLSPFHVTRSRVVSCISTEQVEAPKNYVDFEDEPDRLKGMLKGRSAKEKSFGELLTIGGERTSQTTSGRNPAALSSTSSVRSSVSTPPSPTLAPVSAIEATGPVTSLSLKCHVMPQFGGVMHSVAALLDYQIGRYIISLQRTGEITILSSVDGTCVASAHASDEGASPPSSSRRISVIPTIWQWKSLHLASIRESNILLLCASSDSSSSANQMLDVPTGDSEAETRLVAFELQAGTQIDSSQMRLLRIGDWYMDGPAEAMVFHEEADASLALFHISSTHHLMRRSLTLAIPGSPADLEKIKSSSSTALPIPNPFKALKALSREEQGSDDGVESTYTLRLSDASDLGIIQIHGSVTGVRSMFFGDTLRIACWSDTELTTFDVCDQSLKFLFTHLFAEICGLNWTDVDSFIVMLPEGLKTYRIVAVDENTDDVSPGASRNVIQRTRPVIVRSIELSSHDCCPLLFGDHVFLTGTKQEKRYISHIPLDVLDEQVHPRTLWKMREYHYAAPHITCMLPIDLDLIIVGLSDGRLRRSSFAQLSGKSVTPTSLESDVPLQGFITSLHIVEDERTREKFIVGGADDGSIAIWSLQQVYATFSLQLHARWIVFTTPLAQVIQISGDHVGRLKGCSLCISQDGTIAIITVDGYQFIILVPASAAPLSRIHVGDDNILLLYSDGRARLWDSKTMEFRRSMNADKADELLKQDGWNGWSAGPTTSPSKAILSIMGSTVGPDSEAFIRACIASGPVASSADRSHTDHLRSMLSVLLTFGLSGQIDIMCREKLKVDTAYGLVGYASQLTACLFTRLDPLDAWTVSSEVSASRSLALVAVLQALIHREGLEDNSDVDTVMTFYVTSLPEVVGPAYKSPSLSYLAKCWLQSTVPEIRAAARLLFEVGVMRLSNNDTAQIVEYWQHNLPSTRSHAEPESLSDSMALLICGFIAVEKYSLLSTSVLIEISKSIASYLHDEESPYRFLAIDLCSRGFPVWQQYVDAVEMLRALFILATTTRKEAISLHNLGLQARSAVLYIASTNTPLFMTTLTIDILHPRSVQHRKSIMQLVIFLIRKKPLVLYSNLPRLVEAVVKSLDPNSTHNRDAVLDSATDILGHVVQTFPTVDFHMPTQRLAVGTSEGAVVMYDLKTATRLYVLEGHKKRTAGLSFSPDGRRLVTVSLEESAVLVWKVGSSFTSFFTPGAPPRQGHNGSEPYKTLNFNVGEEARMTLAATLDNIRFEWPADRSKVVRRYFLNHLEHIVTVSLKGKRTHDESAITGDPVASLRVVRDVLLHKTRHNPVEEHSTKDNGAVSALSKPKRGKLHPDMVRRVDIDPHPVDPVGKSIFREVREDIGPQACSSSVPFPCVSGGRMSPCSHRSPSPSVGEPDEFGGFPGPPRIVSHVLKATFPGLHRRLKRSFTMPRTETLIPQVNRAELGSQPPSNLPNSKHVSYLPFKAIVSRNSAFSQLSTEHLEELGGIEYRALTALLWIVPLYYFGILTISFIVIAPYMSLPRWAPILVPPEQHRVINPVWFSAFQVVGAWANTGMSLVDQNMIPFREAYPMIIFLVICVLAGNSAFPVFLRFMIWVLSKICPVDSRINETLQFLLDHPRRCFIYLFPSSQTWILFTIQFSIDLIAFVAELVLNINNPEIDSIPTGVRVINALLAAAAVRSSGFQSIAVSSLAPAVQVLDVILMYITIYPIALSVRSTNVYEERALGIYKHRDREDEYILDEAHWNAGQESRVAIWGRYLLRHARKQLSFDMWWLALSLFLLCIIERTPLAATYNAVWFNIWSLIFELVSAYGTVGLSLGIPYANYSFSGALHTLSKLILCAVMIRGRHRGLPVALDRAVLLPREFARKSSTVTETHRDENVCGTSEKARDDSQQDVPQLKDRTSTLSFAEDPKRGLGKGTHSADRISEVEWEDGS